MFALVRAGGTLEESLGGGDRHENRPSSVGVLSVVTCQPLRLLLCALGSLCLLLAKHGAGQGPVMPDLCLPGAVKIVRGRQTRECFLKYCARKEGFQNEKQVLTPLEIPYISGEEGMCK